MKYTVGLSEDIVGTVIKTAFQNVFCFQCLLGCNLIDTYLGVRACEPNGDYF